MSETDPGYSEQHAGDVGARRATVGTPTERESINVPPTRAGAAENARKAEAARQEHETFIPETPIPDERAEAQQSLRAEEASMRGTRASRRTEGASPEGERGEPDEEDEDDVRKDIRETREHLGETVSALADKTDVKGRATEMAETAKGKAAEAAGVVKGKAAEAAGVVKGKTAAATGVVKGKTSEVAGKVGEATTEVPEKVKDVAEVAKKRPVLLIAVAGAVTAFVVRRIMRRRKDK